MKRLTALTALGFGLGLYCLYEKEVARVRWSLTYRYSRDGRLVAALRRRAVSAH